LRNLATLGSKIGKKCPYQCAQTLPIEREPPEVAPDPVPDDAAADRDRMQAADKVLLIVDDDPRFTRALLDSHAAVSVLPSARMRSTS
jgi:hypothetical protein